jgi:hypothetical protein
VSGATDTRRYRSFLRVARDAGEASQNASWELTEHSGGSQVVAGRWRAPLDEIHFTARIGYQGRTAMVRGTR